MSLLVIIGIALGLAMDAFAVAVGCSIGLGCVTGRQVFRFGFHFGLFQALMPIAGWYAAQASFGFLAQWNHWIAFGLLMGVGAKAIYEGMTGSVEDKMRQGDPTRGASLVLFSVATSLDAMAVGMSLGMLGVQIWQPALVIGLVTGGLTVAGMVFGCRIGHKLEIETEILGGVILIGIGLKILLGHFF